MNTAALVSVIIPCYNHGAYVRETIDSVLAQTYPDIEILVIDDGSTDDSRDAIHSYGNKVRYVYQPNSGTSAAKNTGLANANGQFVNFLDSDDILLPTLVSEAMARFTEAPDSGVIHTGFIFGSSDLKDTTWTISPMRDGNAFDILAHWVPLACQSMLIKRSVLSAAGEFDTSLKSCEDWDLWLRMARCGVRWTSVAKMLSVVRMRPVSLSRELNAGFRNGVEVIRRAHGKDSRLSSPDVRFAQGCQCNAVDALWRWLLTYVSLGIAQGKADVAADLMKREAPALKSSPVPSDYSQVFEALWYATATPRGQWDVLWPKVRRPLFDFLLREEERLGETGFAARTLVRMVGDKWAKPDDMIKAAGGYALWRELTQRVRRRIRSKLSF